MLVLYNQTNSLMHIIGSYFGGASACASVATVRSSKSRFAMDEYTVCAIYTGHITMAMTFDSQRSSSMSKEECGTRRLGGVLRKR